jgi:spore coat protein U-like protein
MLRNTIVPITAGVLLALAGSAQAATKTDGIQVSATVAKNCIISAPDMNLGAFDGTNDLNASSLISVRCTASTPFAVGLSTGSSGVYTNRTLVNGSATLSYNLYDSATNGTIWGDGLNSTFAWSGTGSGMALANAQTQTVYGRLLASANDEAGPAGTYIDNIVATITY